jgi:DNA polymerase III delta subunit
MDEPQVRLFVGDPFRCDRALGNREVAIRDLDPSCERRLVYADEVDVAGLEIDLRSSPLFAFGQHFVIRRVERIRATDRLRFADAVVGDLPKGTFVTLLASELKSTHPILKACKAQKAFTSLPVPRGQAVTKQAREILAGCGLDPSENVVKELVFRCGGDLLGIAQEANKLRTFAGPAPFDEDSVVRLVFPSVEPSVFPFYDRLGERDLRGALSALGELRDDPGRVLGGALRHLTRLAMIRLLLDRDTPRERMARLVGVPDWLLRRLIGQAKRYVLSDLQFALGLGVRLDVQIKQGGLHAHDALLKLVFAATRLA